MDKTSKVDKEWPGGRRGEEPLPFEDLVWPITDVIRQGYTLTRTDNQLVYDGYNTYNAGTPSPSELITDDSIAYHAERGRDLLDVAFMATFQLGIEQGRRMALHDHNFEMKIARLELAEARRLNRD